MLFSVRLFLVTAMRKVADTGGVWNSYVWVCVYKCVRVQVSACLRVFMSSCLFMHVCMYVACLLVCVFVYVCKSACLCMCLCLQADLMCCMCMCVHVCKLVCVCTCVYVSACLWGYRTFTLDPQAQPIFINF